jgi:hypothetical protein
MKSAVTRWFVAASVALAVALAGASFGTAVAAETAGTAADWQPAQWANEDTVELGTTAPGESIHWFPVWLVVLDDELYVRLGSRAADRVEESTTKPILGVRIAGKEFARVVGTPVPDEADAVAAAMGEKYWSDVFVRLVSHPLTLRLDPAE